MTPAQLAEDIERRNREAQAVFSVAAGDRTGLNPVVAEALASQQHASGQSPLTQIATQVAQQSVSQPVPAQTVNPTLPNRPNGIISERPMGVPDTESRPQSFADLIMQNNAVRLRNKEAFDRREKADKARLTIAAVTDALASLGNLVGTTQGAFSQPQTYQVPFVHEDAERARAEARNTANMLLRNDQSLRVAQMREESANSAAALRQALEEERTRRAQMNNEARADLARQNAEAKVNYAGVQQGYKSELEAQKQAGRETLAGINNASREKQTAMRVGVSAANNIRNNERMAANGGGRVGGYTTETTIHRDEYGQETGRTTTRTPANGGPSTTTTTGSSGKKPNPMGSAPKQEGKKKKKNPMA